MQLKYLFSCDLARNTVALNLPIKQFLPRSSIRFTYTIKTMSPPPTSTPKGRGRPRTKPTCKDWTLEQLFAFNAGETVPEWEETDAQRNARIKSELNSNNAKLRREVSNILDLQSNVLDMNFCSMDVPYTSYNMRTGEPEQKVWKWDSTLKYIPLISAGEKSLGPPRFDGNFGVPEVGRRTPACNLKAVKYDLSRINGKRDDVPRANAGVTSFNQSTSPDGNAMATKKNITKSKRTATQAGLDTRAQKKRRDVEVTPSPFTLRSARRKASMIPTVPVVTITGPSNSHPIAPVVTIPTPSMALANTTYLKIPTPVQPKRKSLIVILKVRQRRQQQQLLRVRTLLPATARFLTTVSKFPDSITDGNALMARWNAIPNRFESDWAVAKREILKAPEL
jgi:hypothetical protein